MQNLWALSFFWEFPIYIVGDIAAHFPLFLDFCSGCFPQNVYDLNTNKLMGIPICRLSLSYIIFIFLYFYITDLETEKIILNPP